MNLIKPKRLNKGDTIGIIALSSAVTDRKSLVKAKKYLENKGYKVVLSENIFDKNRYLAGSDEKKVQELHRFFQDKSINAILCARGGYGAIRLLDKIDWKIIKNNPKIFAGYSDVTAIESMILTNTGLLTFYAPVAQKDFGAETVSKFTEKSFFDAIQNTNELKVQPNKQKSKTYHEGCAKGILWGGNLATVISLCGLDFIPDEKFIFFAEDLGEDVYKIDKMMTQLLNIEKFRTNIQGIILGDFLGVKNKKHFDELFYEIGNKYKIPMLSGFKITHATEKVTIPYGANAQFSTKDKVLLITPYLTE